MKKIYLIPLLLIIYVAGFTQQKYDDGPIIGGGNFVVNGTWGRNNISFSFINGTADIANDDERIAVRQAFQLWADYANLNFTEVASNGDIQISWQVGNHGDGNPFDGVNGVLAHAFFPPPAGGSLAGDVHFDDDETWTLNTRPIFSGQPIDLVTVAAHEIGHALGLAHSNENCALMNANYNGSHRYLAQDDIDGIQSIYGNRTVVYTANLNCAGGTFFINNLPTGATVFWSSSDLSIASVVNNNNQGTVSRVGNASGNVRIRGDITMPCGTIVQEFMDIHIGTVMAADIVGMDPNVYFSAGQTVTLYANEDASSYEWAIAGGTVIGNSTGQSITVKLDNCFNGQNAYNDFDANIALTNACGTGFNYHEHTYAVCTGGIDPEFDIMVSPNPTITREINVTIVDVNNKMKTMNKDADILYTLYDFYSKQTVVKQWRFKNTNKQTLDVRAIKPGQYILVVSKGKHQQSKQIIIR